VAKKKKNKNRQETVLATSQQPLPPVFLSTFLTPRRRAALCVAALALFWLVLFYNVLTGGKNLWEDVALLEYPYRFFTRMAFFQFEFPHWNPFTFGGMPFFATNAGVLYPVNFLLTLLPVSDAAFWRLLQTAIVFHVLIAGVCMFAYLRFKERPNAVALFGAIAFMFGGAIITRLIHSSILYIIAWLPLLLMLLEKGVREIKPRHTVAGGLILGAVMQAGHAQVMFYAIIFMLTYAASFIVQSKDKKIKRVIAASCFFAVAAGLCLVQYLPMFEMGGQTARIQYTIQDASVGSLQFVQLLTALMPKVFGAYTGSENVPAFWLEDAFRHGYYNYWETGFYFGVSTLILAFFIFRKIKTCRSVQFASAWIFFSFLIALGGNFFFYKLLFSLGIPGFNSFRHTPRILFIWGFLFPVMAAAALDSLEELKSSGKLKIISISLCAGAAILGIVTAAGGLKVFFPLMAAFEERARYASAQGGFLFLNALLIGTVLILFFKNVINVKTARLLIIACLVIDMFSFAAGQHMTTREGAYIRFRGAADNVEAGEGRIFRINTRQFEVIPESTITRQTGFMTMDRNQGYVSAIETMEGYNPFRLKYASLPLNAENFNMMLDLFNIAYYVNPRIEQGGQNVMLRNETNLPRAKLFYKAKVVHDYSGESLVLDYMNSGMYDHRNEVVVTDQSLARFTGDGGRGEARITKRGLNRIEIDVDTDREAILWLSEIWYPAWKATVNGEKTEIHRANHSFRAVTVPAGSSKVVFKFDSLLFNIGALISSLTLIAALAYLLAGVVKRKRGAVCPQATGASSK
jgi:hypothetical protein